VDDTLVMWNVDPDKDIINFNCYGSIFPANYHKPHIDQIIKHTQRDHQVIIWSQGGWKWAESAINSLVKANLIPKDIASKLIIMDKPTWVYDDMPVQHWIEQVKYIDIDTGVED